MHAGTEPCFKIYETLFLIWVSSIIGQNVADGKSDNIFV